MSNYKTYVLLDALDTDAPFYQSVGNGQRIQIKKIPLWEPTLRQTFQDKDGVSRTIRYKEGSNVIDQKEQIEKEKIDANVGWTPQEREVRKFRNGINITNRPNFQKYLESHPAYDKFDGYCAEYPTPCYKLLDVESDELDKNSDIRLRVNAARHVLDIPLEEKQALLLRLNGSFYGVPKSATACENELMNIVDEADERMLNEILRTDLTSDEETSILIGQLLNSGNLSFTQEPNQVSLKKNGKWLSVKEISDEYQLEERKRYLLEFLTSQAGKSLLEDLKAANSAKVEAKQVSEPVVAKPVEEAPKEDEVVEDTKAVSEEAQEGNKETETPLALAQRELKEAVDNRAHHLTIKKLQKRVDELSDQ